jgi:hypothetical protein
MSRRPGMYVCPVNIESIRNYIGGFLDCKKIHDADYVFDFGSINCVFSSYFGDWLFCRLNKNRDVKNKIERLFWHEMLKVVTENNDEAVKLFFSIFESFCEDFHENKDESYWDSLSYSSPNPEEDVSSHCIF